MGSEMCIRDRPTPFTPSEFSAVRVSRFALTIVGTSSARGRGSASDRPRRLRAGPRRQPVVRRYPFSVRRAPRRPEYGRDRPHLPHPANGARKRAYPARAGCLVSDLLSWPWLKYAGPLVLLAPGNHRLRRCCHTLESHCPMEMTMRGIISVLTGAAALVGVAGALAAG